MYNFEQKEAKVISYRTDHRAAIPRQSLQPLQYLLDPAANLQKHCWLSRCSRKKRSYRTTQYSLAVGADPITDPEISDCSFLLRFVFCTFCCCASKLFYGLSGRVLNPIYMTASEIFIPSLSGIGCLMNYSWFIIYSKFHDYYLYRSVGFS